MKKYVVLFVILNLLITINLKAENNILRILTWSNFFNPEVISEFEDENHVRVEIVPYYTSEMRDFIIKNKNRQQIDVIISEQFGILDYISLDLILPLQIEKLPNKKYMDLALVKNNIIKNNAINLSYGFMGIGYRNDKGIVPPESWSDFISPYEEVRGKIDLISDPNDALDIFLIGMGLDLASYSMEDLISASKNMYSFQGYLNSYEYNSSHEDSNIVTGKSWVAPLYGFEAVDIIENNPNISFVYPKEGVKIWRDYISVIKNGNNTDMAFNFINFVMEPKNAARNTEYNHYASMNIEANKIINPKILNNDLIYKKNNVKVISDETSDNTILSKKHYLYYRISSEFKDNN